MNKPKHEDIRQDIAIIRQRLSKYRELNEQSANEDASLSSSDEEPGILHVYGQELGHDPVFIVGNHAALTRLRDQIGAALRNGVSLHGNGAFSQNDGEGYPLSVVLAEKEHVPHLLSAYEGEFVIPDEETIHPSDLAQKRIADSQM